MQTDFTERSEKRLCFSQKLYRIRTLLSRVGCGLSTILPKDPVFSMLVKFPGGFL